MAIQLRHGTSAEATVANIVLALGQLGVETDTGRIKVGNGATLWNLLPYSQGSSTEISRTALRLVAPDGGLWDLTAANDGIPITTFVAGEGTGVNSIELTSPSGAIWSYGVANDGVLVYQAVI